MGRPGPPPGGEPNRPGPERSLSLAFALAGFVAAAGIMADNSLLTHLATGHHILDAGSVPSTDPYSRFGAGQAWTVQSWSVSVVYAVLDRLAGPAAIRLFHGALGAGIGLGLWRLSGPARELPTRIVLTALPLVVGVGLWSPRPLLVGLAALVALLCLVQQDRPGWLLVPLLWLWANAHGSFPLALALLVLLAIGSWLDRGRPPRRELALVGWAGVGSVLAAVGPIGPALLAFPAQVVTRREAMFGVVEWEPPSYTSPAELTWLALALALLVAARRGLGWRALLPAGAMVLAATLALRNVAPASIVVAALAAPALAGLRVRRPASSSALRAPLLRAVGVASAVALVVAVAAVATGPALDLARYPVAAVDALEAEGLVPSEEVVTVHREAVGNYLTWRYGPGARVFVDDRFDFHDLDLLADHRDLLAARGPREVLDRWEADVVLWEVDHPLVDWLEEAPEWSVRRGPEWVVACRSGGAATDRCPEAGDLGGQPSMASPTGSGSSGPSTRGSSRESSSAASR